MNILTYNNLIQDKKQSVNQNISILLNYPEQKHIYKEGKIESALERTNRELYKLKWIHQEKQNKNRT